MGWIVAVQGALLIVALWVFVSKLLTLRRMHRRTYSRRRRLLSGEYEDAGRRADALLESHLSGEQRRELRDSGWFHVVGCHTGTRYRITHGRMLNVFKVNSRGALTSCVCFSLSDADYPGDIMLVQKIMLECDERAALAVANIH